VVVRKPRDSRVQSRRTVLRTADDRFAALFEMDVTFEPTGERTQLREVALYTVENGKIVQEEFWYQVD